MELKFHWRDTDTKETNSLNNGSCPETLWIGSTRSLCVWRWGCNFFKPSVLKASLRKWDLSKFLKVKKDGGRTMDEFSFFPHIDFCDFS